MVTDQIILDYFIKSNGHINVQRLTNISEEYKEYLDNRYTDSQSLRETIKRIQYNIEVRPVCVICGKPVKFLNGKKNQLFNKTCCKEHANMLDSITVKKVLKDIYSDVNKKQEINNKIRETCLLKYGDEHYSNRIKARETCLQRYGVTSPLKSEIFKQKSKETCLQRYGVEYTGQIPEKIEKTHKVCLEKYGVDSVFKVQKFRNQSLDTCIKKYASDEDDINSIVNIGQLKYVKDKIKNTCLEKYGVENPMQTQYYKNLISSILSSNEIQEKIYNTKLLNNSFNISYQEDICFELLKQKYSDCIRQYKSDLYPYNCDFYIPSLDLYIEYNGSHYHHYHPFNENNEYDLNELNNLKEKANNSNAHKNGKKSQYDNIIYTWTILDLKKRNIAQQNNLNYIEFWNINEVKEWINKQ